MSYSYREVESEKEFNEHLADASKNNKLVIVDFYTAWCGPCKLLAPIFKDVSKQFEDEPVTFLKVNCEDLDQLSEKYNITSIPTLVFIVDKTVVHEKQGLVKKDEFEKTVSKYLKSLTE